MPYHSETEKIRPRVQKYLNGVVYDIGCGHDKISPDAVGFDGRPVFTGGTVQEGLTEFPDNLTATADVVYSSHCLEHMENDHATLTAWAKLLKPGGYLILYLPDGDHYDNHANLEHMRDYNYRTFMLFFRRAFCGEGKNFRGENLPRKFELCEDGLDVGDDKYSFYLVAKKV
jgi:SAM-dependent methyltransferase